jgi:hypothetical protein
MTYSPIAFTAPNYRDYNGYWLKAYETGTTTPKLMASDSAGTTTVSKYEVNSDGFFVSSGGTLVIPHVDGSYDLWLFPTESEADANDTTNAIRIADDVTLVNQSEALNSTFQFLTLASAAASTDLFIGSTVITQENTSGNGGGALYNVVANGTGTVDGMFYVATSGSLQLELVHNNEIDVRVVGGIEGQNIDTQIDAITAKGYTVVIPEGRFHITRNDNREDNATIIGTKMPTYKSDYSQLEGGSILVGTLELKGKNPTVMNLGIDHGLTEFPVAKDDALVLASQTPFTAPSMATVQNVIGLVAEVEDAYHAILIEGHYDTNLSNLIGIHGYFGMALKNTRNNGNNFIFINNGSDSLIVKSDTTSGKVEDVNLTNIVCKGAGTTGAETTSFAVRVSAFDNDVDNVNISNVTAENAAYVIYLDASGATAGTMKSVNLSNIIGSDTGRGVLMDGGSGTGLIDHVMINNVQFDEVEFRPFECLGNIGSVFIDNWFSSCISGATFMSSAFQVVSANKVELSNVRIVENNDFTLLGTVNLANSYIDNKITGNNLFNLGGAGIERKGWSTDSSTGTTITVTPVFDSNWCSLVEMNTAGTRTITQIARDMPSGTKFPYNYKLVILNNATGTLTIAHDPANYIYNKGSVNVSVPPNEAAQYVFLNAVWHQL